MTTTPAKLNEILTFLAVAEGGSFVAGGRAMGVTGSAASKAVMRLETRYGVRLLNRTTRAISLTDEGRRFLEEGRHIIRAVEAAEAAVETGMGEPRGTLRVSVPDAFGRLVLLPILRRYMAQWPKLRVELNCTDRAVDLVEEGFDLAVRIGPVTAEEGLISRVVTQYDVMLCASPDYLAANGTPAGLEDLDRHSCIVFRSRNQSRPWLYHPTPGEETRFLPRSRLDMDSGEALRDAVLAHMGIALFPSFLVEADLADGRLIRVLPDLALVQAPIVALYPSRRMLQPRVRQFIDLMVAELAQDRRVKRRR